MQELPELDLYRAVLAERFAGAQITAINSIDHTLIMATEEELVQDVIGTTVWFVERRAKHLIFHLDNGKRFVVHLSPLTYLFISTEEDAEVKEAEVSLSISGRKLHFIGLKPGDIQLLSVKEVENRLSGNGLDPLDKRFSLNHFIERFGKKRSALKSALMDQQTLSGIGPVYADEIAFASGIRPDVKVSALDQESLERLYEAIQSVLKEAIANGGTGSNPVDTNDSFTGGYRDMLAVYNREGEACKRCDGVIEKITVANRKAYVCPSCQQDY